MRIKAWFVISSSALIAAVFLAMEIQGGWEAVSAALAIFAGATFLACVIAMASARDRAAWTERRAR